MFLGTGARSYMNPEELAGAGIAVHTINGYGDTVAAGPTPLYRDLYETAEAAFDAVTGVIRHGRKKIGDRPRFSISPSGNCGLSPI